MTAVDLEEADPRRTAADWHQGTRPAMLAYAGTGAVVTGLDREVRECLDILEGDDVDAGPVWEAEYERLLALLYDVEPQVAMLRARAIGREHGQAAVAWWQQEALGGRATGDVNATARRLLRGIEDGDPAILDHLPGRDDAYSAGDLEADCDWEEPVLANDTGRSRWRAVSAQLWTAYQVELRDAVHEGVVRACRDALDQPANRPEAADGAPGRRASQELATKWGVLYASTDDGETVRFSTLDPNGEGPEKRLRLNGVEYSLQLGLRRGEVPRGPESYWPLDDRWYVSVDEALHGLRRPDGEVTAGARMRVRDELLSTLAVWLDGDQGRSLVDDGRAAWQNACKDLAGEAVAALRIAFGTARSVLETLCAGEPIRPGDERFLQDVAPQVSRWMDLAGRAPASENPFKLTPVADAPEVAGP